MLTFVSIHPDQAGVVSSVLSFILAVVLVALLPILSKSLFVWSQGMCGLRLVGLRFSLDWNFHLLDVVILLNCWWPWSFWRRYWVHLWAGTWAWL